MLDLNIFKSIDSELRITHETLEKIGRIDYALDQFKGSIEDINTVLVKIMLLLTNFPLERIDEILNKFSINKAWYNQILDALSSKKNIYDILINDDLDKYCLYEALEPLPEEAILYYHIDSENPYIRHYLMYYTVKLKNIKPIITGEDLKKLNIKPGPIYKRILDHVLEAKINGLAYSYEDELALAKKQYEALKGEKNVSI